MRPFLALALGIAATLAATFLWHGPGGAAARMASVIDRDARELLDAFEMQHIEVGLQRGPLARRILLAGEADDFQRGEMVRIMEERKGVAEARWNRPPTLTYPLPLFAEAAAMALTAFAMGLVVASVAFTRERDRRW